MIVHEHVRMHEDAEALYPLCQERAEMVAIAIVEENRPALNAPRGQVVPRAGTQNAWGSRHEVRS